ncbi:MAG: hypothetical protein JO058_01650 [Alphaproteobacteria bacterium]|nr:hypothetical protein [Alphaproteobacteria bacterium]
MSGVGREQAIAALTLLVAALFVISGTAPARWRRPLRAAAIACFVLAVLAALIEIGRWLADPGAWLQR